MKLKRILMFVLAGALTATAGGAAAWWGLKMQGSSPAAKGAPVAAADRPAVEDPKHPARYVSLDKVIVMLRRDADESASHYLAVDLVFKTPEDKEKVIKEHLPLLRSVAVRSLSTLTLAKASSMTVDEFAEAITVAYSESYAADHGEKPFSDVLIGKLIIE